VHWAVGGCFVFRAYLLLAVGKAPKNTQQAAGWFGFCVNEYNNQIK